MKCFFFCFLEVKYWYFNYCELYFNGFDDLDVGLNKIIENVKEIFFVVENLKNYNILKNFFFIDIKVNFYL